MISTGVDQVAGGGVQHRVDRNHVGLPQHVLHVCGPPARHRRLPLFREEAPVLEVELHDLAAEQPQRVADMTAKWEAWAKRAGVLPWIWKPPYERSAERGR